MDVAQYTLLVLSLLTCILFLSVVFLELVDAQNIAINVPRRTIIYGKEDLTVTCSLLQYNELLKVDSIQLLRNKSDGGEELMAALSAAGHTTPRRPGVRISGSLRPLWSAKLNLTVAKEFIDCQDDDWEYMCSLAGMDQLFNPVNQRTEAVPIHIAVKCSSTRAKDICSLYNSDNQTHNDVIIIGITVAIVIVAIGAGVNFAVWRKYHNLLNSHLTHTERRQSEIAARSRTTPEFDHSLKLERLQYDELDESGDRNTYDVLHPYLEPISQGQ